MTEFRKFWHALSWITITLTLGFLALIGYWSFYPYVPLKINVQPMKVLTPQVKVGEQMQYIIDYCKYSNLHSEITRSLVDSFVYNMPVFTSNNELGCHVIKATADIPNITAGKYYYRVLFDYQVNPIRHVLIEARTEDFEITK